MEDRYLFKAQRVANGEWVQGGLVYDDRDRLYRIITEISYSTGTCLTTDNAPRVDKCTICQCTGLKDKNGKLIWENDIVKDKNNNFYIAIWWNDYYQYCWVCIKSIIEIFVGSKRDLWVIVENSEIEIIGNIFDNPELLESEE